MHNSYIARIPDFSPALIADSGQCFRMRRIGEGAYDLIAQNRFLTIRQLPNEQFEFGCTEQEFETFWRIYFDLDVDYSSYIQGVLKDDHYMQDAIKAGWGLKILRQDPWEMLITFLLSQRKAIPLIKRSVEALCENFGDPIRDGMYAFPTPKQLASASEDALAACGLGYRTKYVMKAAQMAAAGEIPFEMLINASDDDLKRTLMSLYGVGIKVASCIMLFGYHRLDLVPVDVWMQRVADDHYDGKFPYTGTNSYGGVLQQYVFEYIRKEYNPT